MQIIKVKVCNENGIHARPATKICEITTEFNGSVQFKYLDKLYDAKNIMGIMLMGLEKDTEFEIIADGENEDKLLNDLKDLIEIKKFK